MVDLNFSQREGIFPISKDLQLKSMDIEILVSDLTFCLLSWLNLVLVISDMIISQL